MDKLDHIDWEIIALLNEDGRMPSAEIERRLENVSARSVTKRIDALIRRGIIRIRAIVNPEKIGYGVMANVFIETEPGRLREVARKTAEFPQVSYVACATGETDVIISVRARNIEELFDFITEDLGKIPGVHHTQSYLLPLTLKDSVIWLPPSLP
jgi:Lrp/AsnC family transcriptional regulator for asnA, asnC and gidA